MITIQNNDGDRRVLLLDNPFALDESPDFPEYLFDVVFIANNSAEETKTILSGINPVTSNKCCYKPLFVSSSLKGKMGNYDDIIDGYADDWNSMEVMTRIEEIIGYNESIGLKAQEDPILSSNQFFIRLTRYLISRKKTVMEPKLDVSASTGYVIPIFDLFYRLGHYQLSEYFVFMQSMTEKGLPFGAALSEAQRLGYAEAEPSADIDGNDAQRKCAISASVAFEGAVAEDSVDVFGIRHITDKDIRAFKKMGRVCKLMVKAKKHKDGISAYVEPALLPLSAPESSVTMNFNMTTLVGKNIGRLSLMGQGAGKYPTGSSLVQDMLDIKCNAIGPCAPKKAIRADNSLERHSYYLRTSAITAELRQLGQMVNGEYIITEPLTVSEMHAMAKRLQKSDPDMFFAGIE